MQRDATWAARQMVAADIGLAPPIEDGAPRSGADMLRELATDVAAGRRIVGLVILERPSAKDDRWTIWTSPAPRARSMP